MKIIDKCIMEDGSVIQIEDWSNDYNFSYADTLVLFSKSKASLKGSFSPKFNENYRFDFNFKNYEESKKAFDEIVSGNKSISEFKENLRNKEMEICI